MDSTLYRGQIANLLQDEEAQLEKLVRLLETEYAAILANNLEALDERGNARSRAMGALLKIQDERRSMLTLLNYPDTHAGLEQMLRWSDPGNGLTANWKRCAELATRCRSSGR